jgi:hypothetical protein
MVLTKTEFVRCVYMLLANSKEYSIPRAVEIAYSLLDETRVAPRTKERLLLLLDALDSGRMTPREFVRELFKEYPTPSEKVKILRIKICE